jgi:uncharacterized protein
MNLSPLSPWWPLLGGAMIGMAAGCYLVLTGRIAGISGLLANAVGLQKSSNRVLAVLFLFGLAAAGGIALIFKPVPLPQLTSASAPLLIAAGLLVGYGTRLGSGCTSGHGVCGLARLSPRSIVATVVFMALGMLTVGVVRAVLGDAA